MPCARCEAMGVDLDRGVLRMSLVHYTSAEDVARLIAALDACFERQTGGRLPSLGLADSPPRIFVQDEAWQAASA